MPYSRGRAFLTDSLAFAHGQPFLAPAPLMDKGAALGYYLGSRRAFYLHPAKLMGIGAHSLIILIAGEKNTGKSVLLKDWSAKFLALQAGRQPNPENPPAMRAWFYDRKPNQVNFEPDQPLLGEFDPLVKHLFGESANLGARNLVNPLDPSRGIDTVTQVAYDIAETVLGRQLVNYEGPALEIAIRRMFSSNDQHVDAVRTYLATPRQQDVVDHYTDPRYVDVENSVAIITDNRLYSAFLEDSTRMSGTFKTLLSGVYGGMFGGTRSLNELLSPSIVNFDWTGATGPGGDLLETMVYRWQTEALRTRSLLNPNLWTMDEEGTRIKNLPHAKSFAQYVREARAYPMISMLATQFSTDFGNLGSAGSSIRELGREIDNGISVRIFGRQPNTPEIIESITKHGVTRGDALSTTLLPQGCWGIKLPNRSIQFVQHVVSPAMLPIYESNLATKGLAETYLAETVPYAAERLRKINALWPYVQQQLNNDPDSYSDVQSGFYQEIGEANATVAS